MRAPRKPGSSHACWAGVSNPFVFMPVSYPCHAAQCRNALAGRGFDLPIARKKPAAAGRKLKRKPTGVRRRNKPGEVRCSNPELPYCRMKGSPLEGDCCFKPVGLTLQLMTCKPGIRPAGPCRLLPSPDQTSMRWQSLEAQSLSR